MNLPLAEILQVCCLEFNVSLKEVLSHSRVEEVVFCRKAFCLIIKQRYGLKHKAIADYLGKSINAVSRAISNQPTSPYYLLCLKRINNAINERLRGKSI